MAIAQVIREVEESKRKVPIIQNLDNAIKCRDYNEETKEIDLREHEYVKNLITARIDIKNEAGESNDIEILYIDKIVSISTPQWFCYNGKGYILHSQKGSLDISFKCIGDGNLTIYLRAKDIRDENSIRLPIFINYKSFRLNGQEMLSALKECSHDKPYKFECQVKDGDSMQVYIEWEPSQHMYFADPKTIEKVIEKIVVQKETVYDDSKCEALRSKLLEQENTCEQLRNSISYRLGYALTNPVRIVRNIFKK